MGDGAKTALDLMQPTAETPLEEPAQLDLIAEDLGLPEPAGFAPAAPARGRPRGARNKRTMAWVEYLEARYTSPLERLLQMGAIGVDELARRLQCKPLEAWQEIRQAMTAALPYMHQRQPISVDLATRKTVKLVIHEAPDDELEDGAGVVVVLEHQPVENAAPSESKPDAV